MRILYLSLFLIISFSTKAQRQNLVFESTFENPGFVSPWDSIERCYTSYISPNNSFVKQGGQSVRFYSSVVDTLNCNLVRSQLVFFDTTATNYERWYGMSIFLGAGYPLQYDGVENFFQIFRIGTESNPPLSLAYYGYAQGVNSLWPSGEYIALVKHLNSPDSVVPQSPMTIYINPLKNIQRNKWIDIVMRVKWANDTTGRIRVWVDGELRYSYNGVTNHSPNYVRLGIDKWDWRLKWNVSSTQTRELFVDEFRIGNQLSTYNDVAPGSNSALPIYYSRELTATKSGNRVVLNWEAEVSGNFTEFEVERSESSAFKKIGSVKGNLYGTSYQYIDNSPNQINYYRVKGLFSGESPKYSRIVSIRYNTVPARVRVYDMLGRMVKEQIIYSLNNLRNELNVPPGVYIVVYENGDREKILK